MMNNKAYAKIAKLIAESEDAGGELVKLISALEELLDKEVGILITQAVPGGDWGNPIVHMSVFTNKQTDFPLETERSYKEWVRDYCDFIWKAGECDRILD